MERLLAKCWVDVSNRDDDSESLKLARSQDKIVSLVEKSHSIISVLVSRSLSREEDEELVITVKRKRSGNTPSCKVISCDYPGQEQVPGNLKYGSAHREEGPGQQDLEMNSPTQKGNDEAPQDGHMEEISQRVAEYLAQIRSSKGDPE